MGLHPPRIRYVKADRYTVRSGDDVVSIAGAFGMPAGRWPELVGANPHKRLRDYSGLRHKCFCQLGVGEPLNIPASWRQGRVPGQVGAPEASMQVLDTLQTFQAIARVAMINLGVKWPEQAKLDSLLAVVYSWWPYLKNQIPSIPTTPPGSIVDLQNVIANAINVGNWEKLLRSAEVFLTQYGIPNGELPQVQAIPWGDLPWANLQDVWGKIPPSTWGQLTSILAGLQTPPYTTPPTVPGIPPLSPSGLPNFFDPTTWSQPMYKSVPMSQTTWSDTLTEVLKDPRFVQCSETKSANLDKLKGCPQCYSNATEFVDRFCGEGDPCDCAQKPGDGEPTQPATVQKEESSFLKYALIGTGIIGAVALVSVISSGEK